jgi:hypothetical protein
MKAKNYDKYEIYEIYEEYENIQGVQNPPGHNPGRPKSARPKSTRPKSRVSKIRPAKIQIFQNPPGQNPGCPKSARPKSRFSKIRPDKIQNSSCLDVAASRIAHILDGPDPDDPDGPGSDVGPLDVADPSEGIFQDVLNDVDDAVPGPIAVFRHVHPPILIIEYSFVNYNNIVNKYCLQA